MITGINRLQRPGRSYLHGVLRDAARPYAYRNGARRLLHGEAGCGLRPLYGNHFMPVAFRYLDASYGYEYGSSPAPGVGAVHSAAAPRAVASMATPAGNSASAVPAAAAKTPAGNPASAASVVAPKTEPDMRARDTQAPVSSGGVMPQPAATIDIRIPGGDPHKHKMVQSATRATAPALQQDAGEPQQERCDESKMPQPARAAPLPQRLPPDLSLGALAKMLEQQNFEKPGIKGKDESPEPNALPRSAPRVPMPESAGVKVFPRAQKTAQGTMPERNVSIKPAVASAVTPTRMAARVSARPMELRLPMPRRAAPAVSARASRSASESGREPRQKAGTARGPARATGRGHAQSPRRVVIRRTAPAAFWERSYLSAFELRMFR